MPPTIEPIQLVEAAYQSCSDVHDWLRKLAPEVVRGFDPDRVGALAYVHGAAPSHVTFVPEEGSPFRDQDSEHQLARAYARLSELEGAQVARELASPGMATLSETLGSASMVSDVFGAIAGFSIADSPAVSVPHQGGSVVFTTLTRRVYRPTRMERRIWECLSLHLASAYRLQVQSPSLDAKEVELIFSERGLEHVAPSLSPDEREQAQTALQGVREAQAATNAADALALWPALLAGRWSPVALRDSDGKRLVLLRRNDPDVCPTPSLTRRQRQVLFYASFGWSIKQIAYALGIGSGTVSDHIARICARLGLKNRQRLVQFASQLARCPAGASVDLTPSELDVATRAARGESNTAIAHARGRSSRTIANQLASAYRKLGVSSRFELATRLGRPPNGPPR